MHTRAERILRRHTVCDTISRSSASLHGDMKRGVFPPPVKIGPNAAGWPEGEVAAIQKARIAGKTDDQIRELVQQLIAARTAEPMSA